MATQGIQGLFGGMGTPEEMQQQAVEQKALQFAQMSPQQQLSYNIYKNTGNLGRGLAGAMGVNIQDPAIKRATMLRQLASQFDTNTVEGLQQMAQAVQGTDPELGYQIMQRAQAMELAQAKLGTEQATAASKLSEKLTSEQKNAAGIADQEANRGTPEWQAAYKRELARLTTKAEGRPVIKEIGVAEGTREPVYTYQTGNGEPTQVTFKNVNGEQKMVPYTGGVDRTTAKTQVSVSQKGEEAFVTELGKLDAKKVNDAMATRENSARAIESLNKLAALPTDQLISGQFASGRVGVTNLLQTLGLASPADTAKLNNSQVYQKVAGDVILQTLGGKLGAGFSNEDRKFIQGLIPQLETSPDARRALIKFMQDKNQEIIKESNRLENYARTNKGLNGFEPKIPMSVSPTTQYSGLSDAELDARIKALQAQQGK
jgi:hypothetical protein